MSRATGGNAIRDDIVACAAMMDDDSMVNPIVHDWTRELRRKIDLCRAELPAPPAGFEWREHFHEPESGIEAWTLRVSFHLRPLNVAP